MVRGKIELIEVPKHFVTDFATIPRVPVFWWLAKGIMQRPAVVHDWLYTIAEWPRAVCDDVLLEAGRVAGVNIALRGGMYAAVRMFGAKAYNQ
jgi:hypothetical protein